MLEKREQLKLSEGGINKKLVSELNKHTGLIDALDKWVLFADRKLIPKLEELTEIVQKLYGKRRLHVYRGIRLNHKVSAHLGLKNHTAVGEKRHYESKVEAVSFTKDIRIARAFGEVVVEADFDDTHKYLDITDELCAILSERRNIELYTQREVILLPPFALDFTVAEVHKKPVWLRW